MNALLVLDPVSPGMGLVGLGLGLGLGVFVWAVRCDQFVDPEGNARRVLTSEIPVATPNKGENHV